MALRSGPAADDVIERVVRPADWGAAAMSGPQMAPQNFATGLRRHKSVNIISAESLGFGLSRSNRVAWGS